ncbi:MAG TPA: hypothetical protein VEV62_11795 [Parafilimonas sp.]|nr:hypothetical protein [Parafilimonas sp.]
MATSKEKNKTGKENEVKKVISSLNKKEGETDNSNEQNSDGSGEAFEQTEEVNEDNFDDLKEK